MLLTEKYVRRLQLAIREANRYMEGFRFNRNKMLRTICGRHYGSNAVPKAHPVNLLHLTWLVFTANLVANQPKVRVTTRKKHLRPYAFAFEHELNQMLRQMDLRTTMRRIVFDSIPGVGLSKTGLFAGSELDLGAEKVPVAELFFDSVDVDDFVFDTGARGPDEVQWEGHRFRLPEHVVHDSGAFENTEKLVARYKPFGAEDLAEDIGGSSHTYHELNPMIELYEVYIPEERLVVTLPLDGQGLKPLRERTWEGPPDGPLGMLGYGEVSNNVLPLPPLANLYDLNEVANRLFRKLYRQMDREKIVTIAEKGYEQDAEAIRDAGDGDLAQVRRLDKVMVQQFPGPSKDLFASLSTVVQLFSRQAGNIELLGGLRASARSATEAAFLQENSGVRMLDMRVCMEEFGRKQIEKMAYFRHTDPLQEVTVWVQVPNTQIEVPVMLTPETRKGSFEDLRIEFISNSMSPKDPEKYAERLYQWFTQVVLPTIQFAQAQGTDLDVPAAVRLLAHHMQIEDADEIYRPATAQDSASRAEGMVPLDQSGGYEVSDRSSPDQQNLTRLSQQMSQSMPGQRSGDQAPPHMSLDALKAAARGM